MYSTSGQEPWPNQPWMSMQVTMIIMPLMILGFSNCLQKMLNMLPISTFCRIKLLNLRLPQASLLKMVSLQHTSLNRSICPKELWFTNFWDVLMTLYPHQRLHRNLFMATPEEGFLNYGMWTTLWWLVLYKIRTPTCKVLQLKDPISLTTSKH